MLPAAATPAAGPEAARASGSSRSASGEAMPPAEWNRCSRDPDGFADSSRSRYVAARGRTPAQSAVVAVRSYSRTSGLTRFESATNATRSRSRSPSASSWEGSA